MYSEMSDLKTIAIDGVSRLRTKEKSLLEEQRKSRCVITEMENKLESANKLIRSLQSSDGHFSEPDALPSMFKRPQTPFLHRGSQANLMNDHHAIPSAGTISERQHAAELSTEKELRCKAEEICAGVLANSKAAIEERDSEISTLRTQLFRLSGQKYSQGR